MQTLGNNKDPESDSFREGSESGGKEHGWKNDLDLEPYKQHWTKAWGGGAEHVQALFEEK